MELTIWGVVDDGDDNDDGGDNNGDDGDMIIMMMVMVHQSFFTFGLLGQLEPDDNL